MIYFKKRTEYEAEIIADGKIIGTLSKIANTYYELEIDYITTVVPFSMSGKVKALIQKIYAYKLQREKRERESPFHPAKSVLNREYEVKGESIRELSKEKQKDFINFAKNQ